ncbi:MAG: hypothetical protein K2Z81_25725, partial [Cyanobacteria bacterium]|nr:hypothetical protein [Cyanobacteriota bacterium]
HDIRITNRQDSEAHPEAKPRVQGGRGRVAQIEDGIYNRDDRDRVTCTESTDGKLSRTFKYGDAKRPEKATEVTINGTTYKYLGAITSNGQPVMQDGMEMGSWAMYDQKGGLTGHWYGYKGISANGVYSEYDYDKKSATTSGASGNRLSAPEVRQREEGGIWSDLPGWRQERRTAAPAEPTEIQHVNENRLWKKGADGTWTATPIDANKPYQEPSALEAELLTATRLSMPQRFALSQSAREFEQQANLSAEARQQYISNVRRQLATVDPAFKGTYEIDTATGGFTRTAADGPRKGIRDVYRYEGFLQSQKPDGSMDVSVDYPGRGVVQLSFKEGFSADRNTLSKPQSVRMPGTDGNTVEWQQKDGHTYESKGTSSQFRFEFGSDGTFRWKNIDSQEGQTLATNGRMEHTRDGVTTVSERGKVVGYRFGSHEFGVTSGTNGQVTELRHVNENRAWTRGTDGSWSAKPIDGTKPYSQPGALEPDILTAANLTFPQRLKLVESARAYESGTALEPAQRNRYLESTRAQLSKATAGFEGTYEIDQRTGGLVRTATTGERRGVREIYRPDGIVETRNTDGSMELDVRFPDNSRRQFKFKEGFSADQQSLNQPESLTVNSTDGKTYKWIKTGDEAYTLNGEKRSYRFSVDDKGSYSYQDLNTRERVTMHLDGRIETLNLDNNVATIKKGEKVVGYKVAGQEVGIETDKSGQAIEVRHVNENRLWTRGTDGKWTARAIDETRQYSAPARVEADILSCEKLDFAQRIALVASARQFESNPQVTPERMTAYSANITRRLNAMEPGFKGTLSIDCETGSFVQTTMQGDPPKPVRDVYRIDGLRERHNSSGSMDLVIRLPDGSEGEYKFKSGFNKSKTLSQPDSIRITAPDGTETSWKHGVGDEYEVDGVKKKVQVQVTADGGFNFKVN